MKGAVPAAHGGAGSRQCSDSIEELVTPETVPRPGPNFYTNESGCFHFTQPETLNLRAGARLRAASAPRGLGEGSVGRGRWGTQAAGRSE